MAGFSYRWAYYYNFGLKHLVFELPAQALVIGSLELIRSPADALLTLSLVLVPLVLVSTMLRLLQYAQTRPPDMGKEAGHLAQLTLALGSPFVVDALRAATLIYSAFLAGSLIGYRTYVEHITKSPRNPLPAVTALFTGDDKAGPLPLFCGDRSSEPLQVIGDLARLSSLRKFNRTCSLQGRSWRLLYQTEHFVYLFSTDGQTRGLGRPLTLVIPSSDGLVLVME